MACKAWVDILYWAKVFTGFFKMQRAYKVTSCYSIVSSISDFSTMF